METKNMPSKISQKILQQSALFALVVAAVFASFVLLEDRTAQSNIFFDVDEAHEYGEAISFVKDTAIVQGYSDGTYRPGNPINRAEFTKIVIEAMLEVVPEGKNCFPDVSAEWFASYICAARDLGLVKGYPDGSFRPGNRISFVEAAKIVMIALTDMEFEEHEIWFYPYVNGLASLQGIPLTLKSFSQEITRGEMAEIIFRLLAKPNKQSLTFELLFEIDSIVNGPLSDEEKVAAITEIINHIPNPEEVDDSQQDATDTGSGAAAASHSGSEAPQATANFNPIFQTVCAKNPDVELGSFLDANAPIKQITPPGFASDGRIKWTSWVFFDGADKVPVYAPADADVVSGFYFVEQNQAGENKTKFIVSLQASCEINMEFFYLESLSEKIRAGYPSEPQAGGTLLLFNEPIKIKKGDLIGYYNPVDEFALNFGVADTSKTLTYANNARYERSMQRYAVCPYDYFDDASKASLMAKFATVDGIAAPNGPCSSPVQDVVGSIAGQWYSRLNDPADREPIDEQMAVAMELTGEKLVIEAVLPTLAESGFFPQKFIKDYKITKTDPSFKDPKDVTTSHCYFLNNPMEWATRGVMYFKIISESEMQMYYNNTLTSCPASFPEGDPRVLTFYR